MANRDGGRVLITPLPSGLHIEIRPLVRGRRNRLRLSATAGALIGAGFFGGVRLAGAWEAGLQKGDFGDLPFPLLAVLTAAVGLAAPLALVGLAALAFAEETVDVRPDEIVIETCAFERTILRRFDRAELECWRETFLPLPPWWTWAVERLAAQVAGRMLPLAGMAGPREKRRIAAALALATGKPIVRDFALGRGHGPRPGGRLSDKIRR